MAGAALSTLTNKKFHPCKLSGVLGQLCAWGQQLWAQAGSVIWVGGCCVCYHCSLPLQSPLQICLQPLSGLGAADKEGGE